MAAVPKDVILDILDFIEEKKIENSSTSYISIKNALKLFSIPVPVITIPRGTRLYRLRIHREPGALFKRVQDLGHRVDRNGITEFGRANEPLQSLFYCSDIRDTAFCETSGLVRKRKKGTREEYTVGIWETQRDILMASLPRTNRYKKNTTVQSLNKYFNDYVAEHPNEDLLNLRFLLQRLAHQFSLKHTKKQPSYLITAAFSNYLFETPMASFETKEKVFVDGIVYPSVFYKEQGMNLAIRPELIENGHIKLVKAIYNKMELINSDTYAEILNISSKAIDQRTFEIIWE